AVVDPISGGEDATQPSGEQPVVAYELVDDLHRVRCATVLVDVFETVADGLVVGSEVAAEREAEVSDPVASGEIEAQVHGRGDQLLAPDVLELPPEGISLVLRKSIEYPGGDGGDGGRKRAGAVPEAEVVERSALVRLERLERRLGVATEGLTVEEAELLGKVEQVDVDQASREVSR